MSEPTGREPMSDEVLAQIFASFNDYVRSHDHVGTFACCSAHAAADWVHPLLRELKRTRTELSAHVAAESADAAAGSYAGRAEAAEAEVERLRLGAEIDRLTIEKLAAVHDAAAVERDAATARAQQAEAALAELREMLAAQLDGVGDRVARSEIAQGDEQVAVVARAQAGTYHTAAWMIRNPEQHGGVNPRTDPERAADEQGDREQLLRENPELIEQIQEGIAEAEAGQTAYLGSFAQYLDDEQDDDKQGDGEGGTG